MLAGCESNEDASPEKGDRRGELAPGPASPEDGPRSPRGQYPRYGRVWTVTTSEKAEVPFLFLACNRKLYRVPGFRPVTRTLVVFAGRVLISRNAPCRSSSAG